MFIIRNAFKLSFSKAARTDHPYTLLFTGFVIKGRMNGDVHALTCEMLRGDVPFTLSMFLFQKHPCLQNNHSFLLLSSAITI